MQGNFSTTYNFLSIILLERQHEGDADIVESETLEKTKNLYPRNLLNRK